MNVPSRERSKMLEIRMTNIHQRIRHQKMDTRKYTMLAKQTTSERIPKSLDNPAIVFLLEANHRAWSLEEIKEVPFSLIEVHVVVIVE